jgi:hypothetical protein
MLHNHVPSAVSNGQAAPVGQLPAEQNMSISIVLPLRNQSGLTSLLGRLYDPSSPDYRHFLTVQQFADQFGPMAEDYQAVVSFAQANGFVVTDTPTNRLVVPINGSVAQINKAFNLTMKVYQHPTENRTFYAPDREPSLNLGVRVAHVAGLNNFSIPRPMLARATGGQAIANVTGSGPGGSYLGSDMRAAYYGGSTLTGTGQAVGLLEFGGYQLSDVNATFSSAGQSYSVPINNVLLDGATGAPYGDDGEQVLDIVQAIGMAPGLSQVRVYIGSGYNTDDANIFNSMASENIAKQISVSWGWVPDDPATDDVFFEEFAAQGQSIFVASGDVGAFDAAISPYFYPGEDAYVTAVGATHLNTNSAGGTWLSETAWNSEYAGSGGGISPDGIAIPSWQVGVANASNGGSPTLRNVPDVAMEGDFDNYLCSLGYGCGGGVAGTSFAAPRWAGFMALVNQQAVEAGTAPMGGVGFINPQIYAIGAGPNYSSDLHDITVGNNDTENQPVWFNAVSGYDLVTGWGSANGQDLIDALAGPQVPGFWLASSLSNVSLAQGASSSTTITVTDAGGFTGNVSLAITSTLPTGVTASWGTNPTSGTSILTLTASSSAPAATATVTVTGTSGSMTVSTNFTASVHPPSFMLSASPGVLTISQGASGTSTVTVTPQYGFSGNVSLAVTSALPSGVTASWSTNPTSGTSVLTLTASSSAPAATAAITITGTSGSLTASTTVNVTVYAPNFTLSASNVSIGQGSSGISYVYVYAEDGFTGSVNLAVTGVPSGVTASFAPNPTSGGSTLTLTASSTAAIGTATLTITGTSGSLSATTTLTLGVFAPGFLLSASSASIGQGSSGTSWVYVTPEYGFAGSVNLAVTGLPNGVTASFLPNPTTGSSTLTLTASSTAAIGTTTLTITGTSGSLSTSTTFTLGVYAPSFTLSDYSISPLGQGTSSTTTVYVNPQYGFTGSVNLSVTGLPSGVTASFSPNPTTSYSTLTLTASSTAAVGSTTLTITGASGSVTATTTLPLTVAAPSFTLSTSNVSVGQGSSGTSYVYVYPQNGFSGSVNLAVTGLPSGVTAAFSPNPTTGNSTLTLTASSSASPGTTTLTVTGTSGLLAASTTLTVSVSAPNFTLSAGSASIAPGSSGTSSIYVNQQYGFTGSVNLAVTGLPSGVTGSFTPNPTTGSSTLTLTASSSAVPGQYSATVTGTSGSLTVSTPLTVSVSVPSFTLSAGSVLIGQGGSATSYVYVYGQSGFSGSVNLAVTGLPSGVTASFSPNPTTGSSTLTLTASNTATLGTATLTITGTSGSVTASTTISLGVTVPSFTLSDYSSVSIGQGSSGTSYVYVNSTTGFTGSVHLAVTGLPSGVTASFAPNPTSTGPSMLTLTASSTASPGTTTVTVTGTSGSLTASTTLSLTVYVPSFTLSDYSGVNVGQGTSATSYVYVNAQNGFTGSVNLAVTGLPSGVTASFSPNPTSTGLSILTLTASSTASLGQCNVTITGTSGSLTATATLNVTVYAPTFTLSAGNVSIGQGSSGSAYVYVSPQFGFSGSVHLAATGLPSGVAASFGTNPTTGSSLLTLTASSTATLGQYNVIITGTSGSLTATTILSLAVYAPTFTLMNYSGVSLGQGSSGASYVYVNPQYGFTGSVNLTVTGLPSGVTASFSPNPVSTGSSLLTLTASSTASLGQYNAIVTGTSGSLTQSIIVNVIVSAPSFTLSDYSSVTIGQGSSTTSYVYVYAQNGFSGSVGLAVTGLPSGVTGSFSPNPTSAGSSMLTLTASSTASLGQYTAIITGTSGSLTASTPLTVGVYVPSFTLSDYSGVVIDQGTSGTSYVSVNAQYGFAGSVSLAASGLPSGVTASFAPNPTSTGSSVMTLTASNPATSGTFTVTITGTSGSVTASTTISLTVYPETFTLSDAPSELTLAQGGSGRSNVYVVPQYGFAGSVGLAASGLPSGVTASFSPNPATGSSVLTLTASNAAATGPATVTITGTSGTLIETAPLALTVSAVPAATTTALTVTSAGAPVTSIAAGSVVTLTAAVSAGSTTLTAGQVWFCDATAAYCEDIHLLGTAQLTSAGTAVLKFIPATGIHSYKAVFAGTQSNAGSSSSAAALAVTSAIASTTTLAQSGAAGNYTLTATVTAQGLLSPTGNVSFQDTSSGNAVVGTAALGPQGIVLSWQNPSSPTTGSQPQRIATGDFNGDGIPDLAVANYSSSSAVTILLGKGDGTFTSSAVSPPAGSYPGSIVVADFNSDGKPDLAVTSTYSNTVTILLGNGDGTFTQAASLPAGSYPSAISSGDFNGDGIPDLAAVNQDSNTVTILLGNGDGTFTQAASPATGSSPRSIAVGDFNGDGIPDLAVANEFGYTVTILLGNGDGTFTASPVSPQTGSDPSYVAVGDFNSDGIQDLAVANGSTNSVSILLGNGDGTFTPAASPATGSEPEAIAVGDFNGDGKVDLAVSNNGSNSVTLLLGNGDGTFTAAATQSVGTYPSGIAAAPFTKNGNPGLAVANSYSNTVTVLTSQLTQTATATASNVSLAGHGVHQVDASYPGDSNYSSSVSATVGLTAEPPAPTITWPTPAAIAYGTALSATQLDATATVAGTFAYSPALGTVPAAGPQTLTATFTPTDTTDYATATATVTLAVNKAPTTLALIANPASSAYGQQVTLSATLSPSSAQSNATNGEAVSFYSGSTSLGAGTLSSGVATLIVTTLPTGTDSLTAAYGGDTNFNASGSNTLPYTVSPLAPAIGFSVPNHTYGDAPFAVSATSTSPGAIAYSVVSGPATVSGSTVTLTGAGTVVLQASQAASGSYSAATQNATFAVAVESQTIAFAAPASPVNFGAAPVSLSASASSGLAVTFSVLSGPGLVSGSTLTITGAGSVVVAADQAGNTNYTAAAEVTRAITVSKIAPSVGLTASPNPVLAQNDVTLTATVASPAGTPTGSVVFSDSGTPLGTANLNGGIATLTVSTLASGSHSITAVYAGDGNFNSVASAGVSETVQDFTLTTNGSSQTVQPGGAAIYTFPVTPSGGTDLPAAVAFAVSGLPAGFTATFNPASLAAGSPATTVTLTIEVPQTATLKRTMQPGKGLPLVALGTLLLPWAGGIRRSRAWLRRLSILAIMLAGAGGVSTLIGCGGGGSSGGGGGTQPQTYNITVTATSGALVHSTTVTVTVQ